MRKWSDECDLYLFTPEELEKIPEGTVLTCINEGTKGKDYVYIDPRYGYTAFGVKDPWNHPLKDLFLIFKLIE